MAEPKKDKEQEDVLDKRGVLCLIPIYDSKEAEMDFKTAQAIAGAYVKVFYGEGKGMPKKIMGDLMDQGIALCIVIGSSEVKDYQELFGERRHVYVAPPRSAKKKGVDGVVYDVLKKMKEDGVVKALI